MWQAIMQPNLRGLCIALLLGAMGSWPTMSRASPQRDCALSGPPREAAVTETDGNFYFIFPRMIPKMYVGCQAMWDEGGKLVFLLTFSKGQLIQYEKWQMPDGNAAICQYRLGASVTTSPECPSYESLKTGLKTLDRQHEPPVPPDRDPRR